MTNDTRKAHEIAWYFETLEPGDVFNPDEYTMVTVLDVDPNRDNVRFRETRFDEECNVTQSTTATLKRDRFAQTFAGARYASAEEMRCLWADAKEEFAR